MAREFIRNDSSDDIVNDDNGTVLRIDIGAASIRGTRRTTQGFLKIPANITRTGILEYRTSDGRIVKELRHPDDVMRADSLATLEAAPVTDEHPLPERIVTPANVAAVQTGVLTGSVRNDGRVVSGELIVQRADTIGKVERKELVELSPGYRCQIDPTPGTWNGERYDQRQTNIVYNHIALLPAGAGRSGSEIALRNDDAYSVSDETEPKTPEGVDKEILPMKKIRFRLDGVTYEIEVPEALAATLESSLAAVEQQRSDSKDAYERLQGEFDALKTQNADLQMRYDDAISPAAIARVVAERAEVEKKAALMAPEIKCDGKDLLEIRKEALTAQGFDRVTLDSKEAGYIEGAFAGFQTVETAAPAPKAQLPGVPMHRTDSKEIEPTRTAAQARAEMVERNRNMWQKTEA